MKRRHFSGSAVATNGPSSRYPVTPRCAVITGSAFPTAPRRCWPTIRARCARGESRHLVPIFRKLTDKIQQHPYVLCHRDYHGQNIHILNNTLFIIDYQDLRMGPDTYDMASLLRDRGVARILGETTEIELLDYYARGENL